MCATLCSLIVDWIVLDFSFVQTVFVLQLFVLVSWIRGSTSTSYFTIYLWRAGSNMWCLFKQSVLMPPRKSAVFYSLRLMKFSPAMRNKAFNFPYFKELNRTPTSESSDVNFKLINAPLSMKDFVLVFLFILMHLVKNSNTYVIILPLLSFF